VREKREKRELVSAALKPRAREKLLRGIVAHSLANAEGSMARGRKGGRDADLLSERGKRERLQWPYY